MQMMRLRGVWTTNTCALLIGFSLFGGWVLIAQLVQVPTSTGYGFGASVTQAGLYLLPGTLGMLFFSAVAGRLSNTVGSKVPLALGTLVSTVAFVLLAVAHTESWEIYLGMMLMGIGIGLAFSAMANLIVEAVPREQTGVATGMHTITRTIGNAFGSQASAAIIAGSIAASGAAAGERLHDRLRRLRSSAPLLLCRHTAHTTAPRSGARDDASARASGIDLVGASAKTLSGWATIIDEC